MHIPNAKLDCLQKILKQGTFVPDHATNIPNTKIDITIHRLPIILPHFQHSKPKNTLEVQQQKMTKALLCPIIQRTFPTQQSMPQTATSPSSYHTFNIKNQKPTRSATTKNGQGPFVPDHMQTNITNTKIDTIASLPNFPFTNHNAITNAQHKIQIDESQQTNIPHSNKKKREK